MLSQEIHDETLDINEPHLFEESFSSMNFYEYTPQTQTNNNTPGHQISILINNQDIYTLPSNSYISIKALLQAAAVVAGPQATPLLRSQTRLTPAAPLNIVNFDGEISGWLCSRPASIGLSHRWQPNLVTCGPSEPDTFTHPAQVARQFGAFRSRRCLVSCAPVPNP